MKTLNMKLLVLDARARQLTPTIDRKLLLPMFAMDKVSTSRP